MGRFSPFHLGHERLLGMAIKRFGAENCLVLIGSSDSLNERTPYSFEARKQMIQTVFPKIEILPLPDIQPKLIFFDGSTNNLWLESIKRLAKARNEKFAFLGGAEDDLKILSESFETIILTDRFGIGENVSATKIREALKMINPKNLEKVINFDFK